MTETLALEARNIFKWFPGGFANDMVDFDLRKGEIHVLLGENGAGKSTLMNIIYGIYEPDGGEIFVDGKEVKINDPRVAIKNKIGMVHQHFMLIPVFTVLENIVLGKEDTRGIFLNMEKARKKVVALSKKYGLEIDPDALAGDLPVGVQQRVEILKALYRKANILVLDEPTAVLTPQEADKLFKVMRDLRDNGVSIIFITHKLKEVMSVADRITVMRGGKVEGTADPHNVFESELAKMMVGRQVLLKVKKGPAKMGNVELKVRDLSMRNDAGVKVIDDFSLDIRSGEILGLAGVQGNGQSEFVEGLAGMRSIEEGSIRFKEVDITNANPRDLVKLGVAYIPEDRQRDGLVLPFHVADNLVLNSYYKEPFSLGAKLNQRAIEANADYLVDKFEIQTADIHSNVQHLSGGNQQKVIVAREFSRPIKMLIAAQPTRGLDVGSIEYVHRYLIERRDQGCAVLLVSTELDEILSLSDRIAVMYSGQLVADLSPEETSKEQLGLLMAGVGLAEADFGLDEEFENSYSEKVAV
jgi:simple sugar transport system ATP-binding protein